MLDLYLFSNQIALFLTTMSDILKMPVSFSESQYLALRQLSLRINSDHQIAASALNRVMKGDVTTQSVSLLIQLIHANVFDNSDLYLAHAVEAVILKGKPSDVNVALIRLFCQRLNSSNVDVQT